MMLWMSIPNIHGLMVINNKPHLHKKAIDYWETVVSNSDHYLEYGMGGSTIRASEICRGEVTTVETSPKFYNKIKHLIDDDVNVHCMDWECRALGYPKQELSESDIKDYAYKPFNTDIKYDAVLVDGRFRMACLMTVFNESKSKIIMLDDSYRKAYKPLLEIIPPTKRLGNMAIWENNTQTVDWNTEFITVAK